MAMSLALGSRLPAYSTSMGRVLLSGLSDAELDTYVETTGFEKLTPFTVTDPSLLRTLVEKVRSQGFALVDQELEEGIRSVAAPIHNARHKIIAALNVSCHASRTDVDQMLEDFKPRLLEAASVITQRAQSLPV